MTVVLYLNVNEPYLITNVFLYIQVSMCKTCRMILDINNENFIQCNKYFIETSLVVDIFLEAECNDQHMFDVKLLKMHLISIPWPYFLV